MKIGYMKLGRSWKLDPTNGTTTGGDADVARALHLLSRLRPKDEFVLVGRNSGEVPSECGYPSNVVNPWTELWPQLRPKFVGGVIKREPKGQMTAESVKYVLDTYDRHVVEQLFLDLDVIIAWAGQHGTSNTPIPQVGNRDQLTNPQDSFTWYASYQVMGLNVWRDAYPGGREETWLCPDPRNYLKARDIKWPLMNSIVAQYDQRRVTKHERYGDDIPPEYMNCKWENNDPNSGVWLAPSRYTYDALELTALPSPATAFKRRMPRHDERYSFGMLVNENRAYVAKDRLSIIREWVLENWPQAEVFGKWSKESLKKLNRDDIRPCPYEHVPTVLQRWRSTLTTPASGSGWATAKPWECFAYGVVCFFHPWYDDQGHILRDAPEELRSFLRVKSADELRDRVRMLDKDPILWSKIIKSQSEYYHAKYNEHSGGVREIMRRLP